jgi:hypothetical protein
MVIDMIVMHMMKVAIVQIVRMPIVQDGFVAASAPVGMIMGTMFFALVHETLHYTSHHSRL